MKTLFLVPLLCLSTSAFALTDISGDANLQCQLSIVNFTDSKMYLYNTSERGDGGDGFPFVLQPGQHYSGRFPASYYWIQDGTFEAGSWTFQEFVNFVGGRTYTLTIYGTPETGNSACLVQGEDVFAIYRAQFLSGVGYGTLIGGVLFCYYAVRWAMRLVSSGDTMD